MDTIDFITDVQWGHLFNANCKQPKVEVIRQGRIYVTLRITSSEVELDSFDFLVLPCKRESNHLKPIQVEHSTHDINNAVYVYSSIKRLIDCATIAPYGGQKIEMPYGAKVVSLGYDGIRQVIWYEYEPTDYTEVRTFILRTKGTEVPPFFEYVSQYIAHPLTFFLYEHIVRKYAQP